MALKRLLRLACAWVALWSIASSASAAITYKQGNWSAPPTPQSTVTVAFSAAQTAGGLNVVIVGWNDSTSTVNSVSDTKGNTYVRAVGPTINAGHATQSIYYAKNIVAATAGSNTVTVVFSAAANYPDVRVAEYAGLDTANPFDVGIGASGSGTALNSGSVTTTNANDLLVAGNVVEHTTSAAGAGYTKRMQTADQDILEDKIVTTTNSYNATATQDSCCFWIMQLAAFKAATGGDVTAPTVPSNLTATPASSTQINLSWTASTDAVGVTGYQVDRCTGASCTNYAQIATPTGTTFNDTTVVASTTYRYRVRARDAVPNWSAYSTVVNATTPVAPDTTAPTVPGGLTATPISATQINLSWTASTDAVGVTGYQVDRCAGASCTTFAQIATPTTTTFSDTTVVASTTYRYRVRARDAVPNWSGYSTIVNATTPAPPDTIAPTVPTGLTATPTSTSQINLSWTASTDAVGVTGYQVDRCAGASCTNFASIATPAGTTFNDTGLTAGTTYRYRLRARDAVPNWSGYSSITNATTAGGVVDCD